MPFGHHLLRLVNIICQAETWPKKWPYASVVFVMLPHNYDLWSIASIGDQKLNWRHFSFQNNPENAVQCSCKTLLLWRYINYIINTTIITKLVKYSTNSIEMAKLVIHQFPWKLVQIITRNPWDFYFFLKHCYGAAVAFLWHEFLVINSTVSNEWILQARKVSFELRTSGIVRLFSLKAVGWNKQIACS